MVQEWLKYKNAWLSGKGHGKQTKAHFSKKMPPSIKRCIIRSVEVAARF